jgi:hypothetical protein
MLINQQIFECTFLTNACTLRCNIVQSESCINRIKQAESLPARGIHILSTVVYPSARRNIALYIATVKLPLWFECLFLRTVYLVLAYGFCLSRTLSFLPTKTCLNGFGPYRDMKIMTRPVNQSGKKG